ncbi:hypothetical protein A8135_14175 [Legionella jamestowniensis]|uniref:Dot/Icm T4SS effector n=1 Tax=Legionella jamestowniensis TaxID=455 RepID=A0ABX2Y020_9GAMM|nr:hypothetical protein [Legionella jamestowniensis]OCH97535.1 hypothetical protein A8135_14175 [Legionella jamestowniensis]
MKLSELISKYLNNSYSKSEAQSYIRGLRIDTPIPVEITTFIEKFASKELISEKEARNFSMQLTTLNKEIQNCIIHLLYNMSLNIYKEYEQEIREIVENEIDGNLKKGKEIPISSEKHAKSYIGLLNCYQLFSCPLPRGDFTFSYPGVYDPQRNIINYDVPFAINALRLVGKLPTTDNFMGMDLSKPFYPLKLEVVKQEKVPLKKGVKEGDTFYPYKAVSKIAKGDTGDNTFLATNGKKILFIRGVERYSPNAILASKIATLVSPAHFSSERLLDNRLVGSKAIPNYAISVADRRTRDARKEYIETKKQVFPGSGIIDEVTNYIVEGDPNIENFGFSSEDVAKSHLSKIDFDHCAIASETLHETYERDVLTKPWGGIYHGAEHVQIDPDYIKEKLFARLKVSMLTPPLLSMLADKAYTPEDEKAKNKAVTQCINRSNIALDLFFEHPSVRTFLTENPTVLNQCYQEIAVYISTHFEEKDQNFLLESLRNRLEIIKNKVNDRLNIDLPISDYSPDTPVVEETLFTVAQKQQPKSLKVEPSFEVKSLNLNQDHNVEVKKPETTFLSRNWLKLLGIATLTLIGVGVGVALTATGVFAPLGIGITGFTVAAAVGLGSGLVVGGATFGAKIAYDEYQFQSSNPVEIVDEKKGELRPSPSVQSLIEQVQISHQAIEKGAVKVEQTLDRVLEKTQPKKPDAEQIHELSKFEIK